MQIRSLNLKTVQLHKSLIIPLIKHQEVSNPKSINNPKRRSKGTGPNSNAVFAKTLLQKRCFGNTSENAFSWAVVVLFIECLYNSNI